MGTRTALGAGEQAVQENLQQLTPYVVQELAATLSRDIPHVPWQRVLGDLKDHQVDLIAVLLPLSLAGAGRGSLRDLNTGRKTALDPVMLRALRLTQADAERVSALAKEDKWNEADAAIREGFTRLEPEGGEIDVIRDEAVGIWQHQQHQQQQSAVYGPLKQRGDKPASWADVKRGHTWASAKKFLPRLNDKRPSAGLRGTWEELVEHVSNWLGKESNATDP